MMAISAISIAVLLFKSMLLFTEGREYFFPERAWYSDSLLGSFNYYMEMIPGIGFPLELTMPNILIGALLVTLLVIFSLLTQKHSREKSRINAIKKGVQDSDAEHYKNMRDKER